MASKLFNSRDKVTVSLESNSQSATSALDTDILEDIEDASEALDSASDTTVMAIEHLAVLESIRDSLESKALLSDQYLVTLESLKPLADKLGLKSLPAMEDFRNKYAAQSAHTYALEGIGEIIKSFWEKIKAFFRGFFKRVMVFFKRLLKANLDLESYEKYTDQLIAKLNTNKATIGDNTPLFSKLPSYIANKNETKIDSDYILRVGSRKIKNLLTAIDNMKIGKAKSVLNPQALREFNKLFDQFYAQHKNGISDIVEFQAGVNVILKAADYSLTESFNFSVPDEKSLPEDVFMAINERYDGTELRNARRHILSMSDMFSEYNSLPREANIFLVVFDGGDDNIVPFARGHIQDLSYVDNKVNPISSLPALTQFYKDYKNGIAKVDMKAFVKNVDGVAEEVDKLTTKVGNCVVDLSEKLKVTSNAANITKLGSFIEAMRDISSKQYKPGNNEVEHILCNIVDREQDRITDDMDFAPGDFIDCITIIFAQPPEPHRIAASIDKLNNLDPKFQREMIEAFSGVDLIQQQFKIEDPETIGSLRATLKHLHEYLNKFLIQLQMIYKELGTLYYQQVTEIRYALIKYIYDSASRFVY